MSQYIDLGITTSAATLADEATTYLEEHIEGYEPNPGNLEVIAIEAIAPMAAAVAEAAGEVPLEIFINYGTQLIGLPFKNATPATTELTFKALDENEHTVPGGTVINIGGIPFATNESATIPPTSGIHGTVTTAATAIETGEEANGLSQGSGAELVDALTFVESVEVVGTTSGGTNEETPAEYASRLATALSLQAPRPITAVDYANFIVSADIPVAKGSGYLDVKRAVAIDGYSSEVAFEFEGKIESGHLKEIKEVTSFTGLEVGAELTDSGGVIPVGTKIAAMNEVGKIITLSNEATAEHAKEKIKVTTGSYHNERTVTAFVEGLSGGEGTSAERLAAIKTYIAGSEVTGEAINGLRYPGFREINFKFNVLEAEKTTVNILYTVNILPGFSEAGTKEAIATALSKLLNPRNMGNAFGVPEQHSMAQRHDCALQQGSRRDPVSSGRRLRLQVGTQHEQGDQTSGRRCRPSWASAATG